MMSGTLVAAAHTLAHNPQGAGEVVAELHGHDEHHVDKIDHEDDKSSDHSEDSHDTSEHGAELHFTAFNVANATLSMSVPRGNLNATHIVTYYPAPQLPPDPFPDRA